MPQNAVPLAQPGQFHTLFGAEPFALTDVDLGLHHPSADRRLSQAQVSADLADGPIACLA